MTIDEAIGQTMMFGFYSTTIPQTLRDLITHQRVGGIILFARNIGDAHEVRHLTSELQRIARDAGHPYPLLIAIDQENGAVRRLKSGTTMFPGNMELASSENTLGLEEAKKLVYDVAYATGHELYGLGINMNLAPVADVNNNPTNPVIGSRSFGDDPQRVSQFVVSAMHGYQDAHIIPCLKHFPGHGDTDTDSHLSLPTIPHSLEHLRQVELVPFQTGIRQGVEAVMTAHILFSELDTQPATISSTILRSLLREQLGFEGVIISDCMEMRAISDTVGTAQGVVQALRAGTDIVLVSHHHEQQQASIAAIHEAISKGHLSPEAIQQAAQRVSSLKQRTLSWDHALDMSLPAWVGGTEHQQLSNYAYAHVTLKNVAWPSSPVIDS